MSSPQFPQLQKENVAPFAQASCEAFVTGILEAVRSQSGGNLSQSCTISLAKHYNTCSLCSLSNSIATTFIFAWNKSWQEKLRRLFTSMLMILGKMFFILIFSIKAEILFSKK